MLGAFALLPPVLLLSNGETWSRLHSWTWLRERIYGFFNSPPPYPVLIWNKIFFYNFCFFVFFLVLFFVFNGSRNRKEGFVWRCMWIFTRPRVISTISAYQTHYFEYFGFTFKFLLSFPSFTHFLLIIFPGFLCFLPHFDTRIPHWIDSRFLRFIIINGRFFSLLQASLSFKINYIDMLFYNVIGEHVF